MPHSATKTGPNERLLQSPLLRGAGFSHGFFTRRGGVSQGVFASLNFSSKTGDSTEHVEQNLALAARDLGISSSEIYFVSQVHGVDVVQVEGDPDRAKVLASEGDIVVTRAKGKAAAVRTADCVPILVGCRNTGWVAACHAGWRGCIAGAPGACVAALRERGASDLLAAIGPHIQVGAFEVSEDVAEQLREVSSDKDIIERGFSKPHVNLRKMVRSQLTGAGIEGKNIDDVFGCTHDEPEWFFSYRRDKNPSGRLLSAIVART